jgi:energy-coupling factor transporter transmembrane protein EcfT
MRVDSEFAGLLLAVGFVVLGLVSLPIASVFVLGTIVLGVVVAILLRFIPSKFIRRVMGMFIILLAFVFWWEGHTPRRPRTVSPNARYVLPNNVPFRLHRTGYWLECWFDQHENVDRCKLTDEHGTVRFEDVFLPCEGCTPLPQSDLVFKRETGDTWIQSCDKRVNFPVIYVRYGLRLLPRSLYADAKREVYCSD